MVKQFTCISMSALQKITIYIFPILMWHYIFVIEIEVFRPVFIVITALHRYISLISTDMSANNEEKQKNAACNMSTRKKLRGEKSPKGY